MFEKIKANLSKILAGIGAVLSAIFFVLYKQKKVEKLEAEKEEMKKEMEKAVSVANANADQAEIIRKTTEKINQERQENDKKINDVQKNNLSSFTDVVNQLR